MIIINSLILTQNDPLQDSDHPDKQIINRFDLFFTIIFSWQMILEVISKGFFFNIKGNSYAYIRDGWNVLDFIIVSTSIIVSTNMAQNQALQSIKALRILRILKPLQQLKSYQSLRILIMTLFQTAPVIRGVVLVAGITMVKYIFREIRLHFRTFFPPFSLKWIVSIILCDYWHQTFYYCEIDKSLLSQIRTKDDCLFYEGNWVNQSNNYDNVLQVMLTLFQIVIGENWLPVVWSTIDINGIDNQPIENNHSQLLIIILVFLFIGNIFMFNMFVGMVINNYKQIKYEVCGFTALKALQRQFVEMQRFMVRKSLQKKLPPPESKLQEICRKITQSQYFELLIVISIIINISIMGSLYREISDDEIQTYFSISLILMIIFHLELLMQFFSDQLYIFIDLWNKYDLFILVLCDFFLVVQKVYNDFGIVLFLPYILRGLRLGRVLGKVKISKNLKLLVDTVFLLIPDFINIMCLILLISFIFAILGMNLFAKTQVGSTQNTYPYYMEDLFDSQLNFQTFSSSMLLLFECSTGQMWDFLMQEFADKQPGCHVQTYEEIVKEGVQGCGDWYAYPFFIFIAFLLKLVILNLFLAVTVQGFIQTLKESEAVISPNIVEEILDKWCEYDPDGTGFITPENLAFFLHQINYPLGFKNYIFVQANQFFHCIKLFNLPIYNNEVVHFMDVVAQFTQNAIIDRESQLDQLKPLNKNRIQYDKSKFQEISESDEVLQVLMRKWENQYNQLKQFNEDNTVYQFTILHFLAVKRINAIYSQQLESRRLQQILKGSDLINKIQKEEKIIERRGTMMRNLQRKMSVQIGLTQKIMPGTSILHLPKNQNLGPSEGASPGVQKQQKRQQRESNRTSFLHPISSKSMIKKNSKNDDEQQQVMVYHDFSIKDSDIGLIGYQNSQQYSQIGQINPKMMIKVDFEKNQPPQTTYYNNNLQIALSSNLKNQQNSFRVPSVSVGDQFYHNNKLQQQLDYENEKSRESNSDEESDTQECFALQEEGDDKSQEIPYNQIYYQPPLILPPYRLQSFYQNEHISSETFPSLMDISKTNSIKDEKPNENIGNKFKSPIVAEIRRRTLLKISTNLQFKGKSAQGKRQESAIEDSEFKDRDTESQNSSVKENE